MMTDPVADMLTRIRNANKALHDRVELPYKVLVVELKYGRSRERVLTDVKRISKPGRRIYAGKDRLPRVLGGMGTAILSTSRGVITSRTAEKEGIGGEVICFVW